MATWLSMCGLREYSDLFVKQGIAGRKLLLLDEPALRQMGVNKLGHRKQIIRRAAEAKLSPRRRLAAYPLPAQWTTREVCDWLQVIQLEQYRQLFFNERVTGEQLIELTDASLTKMGIIALGHRKRILKQIVTVTMDPTLLDPEQQKSAPAVSTISMDSVDSEGSNDMAVVSLSPTSANKIDIKEVEMRKQRQLEALLAIAIQS